MRRNAIFGSAAVTFALAGMSVPAFATTSQAHTLPVNAQGMHIKVTGHAQKVTHNSDGSTTYYLQPVGDSNPAHVAKVTAPPEGFDPTQATDDQLLQFGFPTRPDSVNQPAKYQKWLNFMQNFKTFLVADPIVKEGVSMQPAKVTTLATTAGTTNTTELEGSTNWAAAAVESRWNNPSEQFTAEQTYFQVPTTSEVQANDTNFTIDNGFQTHEISEWVGIGGMNTNKLIQNGVDLDHTYNAAQNVNIVSASFWYEALPDEQYMVIVPLTVNPGDTVSVQSDYSGGTAYFYFEDVNTQVGTTYQVAASNDYIGTSAESVVERPTHSGSPSDPYWPVLNFQEQDFTDGQTWTNSNLYPYGRTQDSWANQSEINMINSPLNQYDLVSLYRVPTSGYTYWGMMWDNYI